MPDLLALDVALLPPANVRDRAIGLSAALAETELEGLRLDLEHLPHITLTQQFLSSHQLDRAFERIDEVLRGQPPLGLRVSGTGTTPRNTVWMAIEPADALASLHGRLMDALEEFEQSGGGPAAFVDGDARMADVAWVAGYRLQSSYVSYTPHLTLGHATEPPRIDPFTFEAATVAACHLGRFCTCRRVLRQWDLARSASAGLWALGFGR